MLRALGADTTVIDTTAMATGLVTSIVATAGDITSIAGTGLVTSIVATAGDITSIAGRVAAHGVASGMANGAADGSGRYATCVTNTH